MARIGEASIRAYVGGSGFGKSLSVNAYLRRQNPGRLMVWDPQDECAEIAKKADSLTELVRLSNAVRYRLRYVPPSWATKKELAERFATFCSIAYARDGGTVYVEELSGVTTPSHAPPAWRQLCVRGRHKGLTVIGCAQRPAQVDKDFFGNCTVIRCFGGLREPADAEKMARVLRIASRDIDSLRPREYFEKDFIGNILRSGVEPIPGESRRQEKKVGTNNEGNVVTLKTAGKQKLQ